MLMIEDAVERHALRLSGGSIETECVEQARRGVNRHHID